MAKFITPLRVELVGNQSFSLTAPLGYVNNKYRITAFSGFTCDGLSKPIVSWGLMGCPFGGADTKAGFIHDALYRSKLLDRRTADYIFYEALLVCGVSKIKARSMYQAVRLGGDTAYDNWEGVSDNRNYVLVELV